MSKIKNGIFLRREKWYKMNPLGKNGTKNACTDYTRQQGFVVR